MKRPIEIENNINDTKTLVNLTSVFEGIASMRISKIKNQVLQSQSYFERLWQMYTQISVDSTFILGKSKDSDDLIDKELFIVITSEGGFSGDIDQKLIGWMLKSYDSSKNDIIVIGNHGKVQLAQQGVNYIRYFKLPSRDSDINVAPIIKEVQKYRETSIFYQTYQSLSVQNVKRINLSKAVTDQAKEAEESKEIINEATYIFEPSMFAVIGHLERSMLQIALSQVILDSKLAQYASRFRAMTTSHQLANESLSDLNLRYNRAKRAVKDERLKEMITGLRKAQI